MGGFCLIIFIAKSGLNLSPQDFIDYNFMAKVSEGLARSLETSQGILSYLLIRSPRRKTIAIHITLEAQMKVLAPRFVEEHRIDAFIREKVHWIVRKTHEIKKNATQRDGAPQLIDGGRLLFFGKEYPLRLCEPSADRAQVQFSRDEGWTVTLFAGADALKQKKTIREAMVAWYKHQAMEILGSRVFHFSRMMGLEPRKITIKTQKTMWGSCHPTRRSINLNWKIIMAPMEVIDYVIVHELSHIRVPNHSARFWREVQKIFPDYRERQKWLKRNVRKMSLEE